MAFNGSGTFNLATGNPVVSGTTISSTWANNTLTDIASGLTNTITRDGQSPATANIPLGNYKLTGVGAPTANGDALVFGENASIQTLKLLGSSSGFVGLKGAAAAGSTTYTLPATDGVAGSFLATDGAGNLSFNTGIFASGTTMLFLQAAAPTGWTKVTTYNDYALRIVSGTGGGTGGSVAFSTAFTNTTSTGAYTLTTSEIPSHAHTVTFSSRSVEIGSAIVAAQPSGSSSTSSVGGGASHSHSLSSLAVQYIDSIIAVKD
jgi:hypothetical protein